MGQGILNSLGWVADLVLKEDPNAVTGQMSEMYLTTFLELSHRFALSAQKRWRLGLPLDVSDDSRPIKRIEIKSGVHFVEEQTTPKVNPSKRSRTNLIGTRISQ
jgi:hypothetical protein